LLCDDAEAAGRAAEAVAAGHDGGRLLQPRTRRLPSSRTRRRHQAGLIMLGDRERQRPPADAGFADSHSDHYFPQGFRSNANFGEPIQDDIRNFQFDRDHDFRGRRASPPADREVADGGLRAAFPSPRRGRPCARRRITSLSSPR
jgi:hypothetical protein